MIRRVFQSFRKPERDLALSSPSHAGDPVPFQRGVSHAGLRIDEAPSYTSSFADPTHAPEIGVMRQTTMPSATLHLKQTGSQGLDILYDPPPGLSPAVDIVFIHGLTGNSYNTWCYSNDLNEKYDIYWPQHLLKFDIPDARILSFGYDANVVGLWSPASTNGVANHAENLLGHVTRLRERTNSEDRALIFVMHSLGGLVVQNALDLSRCSPEAHLRLFEAKTIGLLFMGTPNFGSNKAKWGNLFATMLDVCKKTNKPIVRVLQPHSEVLASIQKKFHEVLRLRQSNSDPIQITCFYEELPLPIVGMIVDTTSATLPGYPSYGIHSNHMGMVRFQGAEDRGYVSVMGELIRWCKAARENYITITELQEECLRYLYFDGLDAREEAIIRPLTGTCSWIWEPNKSSLHRWLKSGHGIYWIQGRPSTGKSTLVKYAVKTAREKALILTGHRPTVLAYFLDSKTSTTQPETMEKIIRVLLWQLLRQDSRYFKFVLPHFEDMKQSRPNFEWKPSVLQSILLEILSHHHTQPIWIFLDGLDEYSGDLFDMADVLNQWSSACSDKVRICISSRPEQELVLSIHSSASILKLEDHTGDDITICAKQEISRLSHLIGNDCCKKLIASISNQANGLFMWVKLASRDIVRTCMKGSAVDYEQLLERLDHLPKEINDLYLKILQKRTDPDDYRKALTMLGIVSFGRRSFTLREFFFIFQSLDSERVNYAEYRDDLVRLRIDFFTGGLLDCRSGRVVFSHGTVATFVHHLQDQQLYLEKLSVTCSRLSQACFVLLHHFELSKKDQYIALPVGLEEIDRNRLQDLRNYAIQHWLDHISCPEMLQKYRLKTATPPHVKNEEFVHWKRSYLARFWEYHPNSSPRLPDLVVTTLAYLLSIITSPSIFSPPNPSEIIYTANDPFFHNHEQSLRRVRRIVEWKNANIDFLITLEITAEYSVSFHAANILNHWDGLIDYIVDPAKQSVPSFEESGVWFDNALRSYSASRTISNLITIRPCALVNFLEVPIPKRRLRVDPSLLDQISIVIWHYIQMETSQTPNLSSSDEQKANTLGTQQDSTMSFSTPVQYAAFFGLDLVIRQLHRHGADVAYFSEESRYGSPLIAAIWGISEKRSTSDENVLIRTLALLDKTERSIVTPGNAGHLGKVTPLNAAVKLYTSYRRRIGLGSEELLEAIACLLELGAEVDQSTRVIVRSNPKLGRYFASTTKPTLPASHAGFGSSAPIDIPSPASLRSIGRRGNASIGGFGNTRISGLTPYGQGPPGRGGARITQTLEERFNL